MIINRISIINRRSIINTTDNIITFITAVIVIIAIITIIIIIIIIIPMIIMKDNVQSVGTPHSVNHQDCININKNSRHRIQNECRDGALLLEKLNGIVALVILDCNHCSYSESIHPITAKEAYRATPVRVIEFQYIITVEAVHLNRTILDTRSNKKSIILAGTRDNMLKDILYKILTQTNVAKHVAKVLESRMTNASSHLETYHVALHHVDTSKQTREASGISSLREGFPIQSRFLISVVRLPIKAVVQIKS